MIQFKSVSIKRLHVFLDTNMMIKSKFQDISAGRDDQILSEVTRLLEKVPKEVKLKIGRKKKLILVYVFTIFCSKIVTQSLIH